MTIQITGMHTSASYQGAKKKKIAKNEQIVRSFMKKGGNSAITYGCFPYLTLKEASFLSRTCKQFHEIKQWPIVHVALRQLPLKFCIKLQTKCPRVTSLDFNRSQDITDNGLVHLQKLPLQHLDLRDCLNITDNGLVHLQKLPLQHLDLRDCRKITDNGLVHLQKLPLQHLNLSGCQNITDNGLVHLQKLPLQHLELHHCQNITSAGVDRLQQTLNYALLTLRY